MDDSSIQVTMVVQYSKQMLGSVFLGNIWGS